jgi:hypothetical protein
MSSNFDKIKKDLLDKYDISRDGKISEEDLKTIERIAEIEVKKAKERDRDRREDTQRKMAWFSLFGMLLYPVLIVFTAWIQLNQGAEILGSMAAVYFGSVAVIVAAFFGAQAYQHSQNKDNTQG